MIIEINNQTKSLIDLKLLKRVVAKFAQVYKIKSRQEVSIAIVNDAEIKKLNKTYRQINKPTDILSFGAAKGDKDFLGEIVIDYAQIKRQAKTLGKTAKQELIFILVHGLLHLVGFNDQTEPDRLKMIKRGEEFIKKLKIKP